MITGAIQSAIPASPEMLIQFGGQNDQRQIAKGLHGLSLLPLLAAPEISEFVAACKDCGRI